MTTESRQPNPFSTRFIAPSVSEFLPSADADLNAIVSRFQAADHRGQIVGPHGSGKTTLLHSIGRQLEAEGITLVWLELHDGQRQLPVEARQIALAERPCVVIVDGYEQLSWWSRRRLKALCQRRGCGLLITAHQPQAGLPEIHRTEPSLALAKQLVARLMAGQAMSLITDDDITTYYHDSAGDIREMLFRLYDVYETRSSCS